MRLSPDDRPAGLPVPPDDMVVVDRCDARIRVEWL